MIHPGVDINAVAGSHVDEVLQACAVSRYLVRVVRLYRGEDASWATVICTCSSSRTWVISFRAPGVVGWRDGMLERSAGERVLVLQPRFELILAA